MLTVAPSALVGTDVIAVTATVTGADQARDGAFQRAAGGVLFLDEIGELGLEEQAKLLRTLESGEVRRVGSGQVTYPDVRVIAATKGVTDFRKTVVS